jgi:hypothetical protein
MPKVRPVLRMPSPLARSWRMRASTAGLTGRRPSFVPFALALASPALTRSRIFRVRTRRKHHTFETSRGRKAYWCRVLAGADRDRSRCCVFTLASYARRLLRALSRHMALPLPDRSQEAPAARQYGRAASLRKIRRVGSQFELIARASRPHADKSILNSCRFTRLRYRGPIVRKS